MKATLAVQHRADCQYAFFELRTPKDPRRIEIKNSSPGQGYGSMNMSAREHEEQNIIQITHICTNGATKRDEVEVKRKGRVDSGVFASIPIPREATSVATMMGLFPVLNSLRTQSRSFCCLSP